MSGPRELDRPGLEVVGPQGKTFHYKLRCARCEWEAVFEDRHHLGEYLAGLARGVTIEGTRRRVRPEYSYCANCWSQGFPSRFILQELV